jgi:hypothetical protein
MTSNITPQDSIKELISELRSQLEMLHHQVKAKCKECLENDDMEGLRSMTLSMELVAKQNLSLDQVHLAVQEILRLIDPKKKSIESFLESSNYRQIRVQVTQGMINQNMITMSEARKKGQIFLSEKMEIMPIPSGKLFETEICNPGVKLKARSAVKHFFETAGVKAGDFIVFDEVDRNSWKLYKESNIGASEKIQSISANGYEKFLKGNS